MKKESPSQHIHAFTLIEVLTVMVLISLFAGIMFSALGKAQKYLQKTRTLAQFHHYIQAYYSFKADYGHFPTMGQKGNRLNLFDNNAVFIQTLSGRKKDGQPIDHPAAKRANRHQTAYYRFTEKEFASTDSPFPGKIVDAFNNAHIFIVIDQDGDGIIAMDNLPNRKKDLHAAVAVYSIENVEQGWPAVCSW